MPQAPVFQDTGWHFRDRQALKSPKTCRTMVKTGISARFWEPTSRVLPVILPDGAGFSGFCPFSGTDRQSFVRFSA